MSTIPSTGPVKLGTHIRSVLGTGTGPVKMSDYYAAAAAGHAEGVDGIPASRAAGPLRISMFRGKSKPAAEVTYATASTASSTQINVAWSGTYKHVIVTWSGGSSGIQTGSSYAATGLTPNTDYTMTVTPYNAVSTAGVAVTAAVTATAPSAVTTVTPGAATTSTAQVTWSGGSYSYTRVTWSPATNGGASSNLAYGTASYTASGLLAGTAYTFAVTAYNRFGVAAPGTAPTAVKSTIEPAPSYSSATKKIYIFADDQDTTVQSIVTSLKSIASTVGANVNISGLGTLGSGSLAYDNTVDCVLWWNNYPSPASRGTEIQTYLNNGKGVVMMVFGHTQWSPLTVRGMSASYQLVAEGAYTYSSSTYSQTGTHQILTGVTSTPIGYYNQGFSDVKLGTAIGQSPVGGIAVFYDNGFNRRVDVNMWPGDRPNDTTTNSTNRIVLNACLWAAKGFA